MHLSYNEQLAYLMDSKLDNEALQDLIKRVGPGLRLLRLKSHVRQHLCDLRLLLLLLLSRFSRVQLCATP